MKITLTFDNGPHSTVTPEVLRILRAHDVRATFFLVGRELEVHGTDLPKSAIADGHWIGNHSFHHGTPLGLVPAEEGVAEVERMESLLAPLWHGERLFRPFGRARIGPHLLSNAVWDFLRQRDYTCVLWNCIAYEWEKPDDWMESTVEKCRALEHSVVVLHDVATGAMKNLDRFLLMLKAEGAVFAQDFPRDCMPMRGGQELWTPQELEQVLHPQVPPLVH
jgi:peptidoglycan/xylan/chitin deacetylase (PgdA/CDA1 family)